MIDETNLSAVGTIGIHAAIRNAENSGKPRPTDEQLLTIAAEADAKNVYGFSAQKNARGEWIPQSIPLGHNHYAALLRYEGQAAYDRAVRKLWKENPARAKALSLPEPPRAGA